MKAKAICGGAATIIAAFATGKGGAYGIDLNIKASVELTDKKKIEVIDKDNPDEPTTLVKYCAQNTLKKFNVQKGAKIIIESDIPTASGLKSSSALANVVCLATLGAIAKIKGRIRKKKIIKGHYTQQIEIEGKEVTLEEIVNIGVDAAFKAKTTVTGAYDDATAAIYGGFTLTDNLNRKLVHRGEMEDLKVVVYSPDKKSYSGKVDLKKHKAFAKEVDMIWNQALAGQLYSAITLNGLVNSSVFGYDPGIAYLAMNAGAIACGLSGKGPSVVALTRGSTKKIRKAWSGLDGRIIECKTNNECARLV